MKSDPTSKPASGRAVPTGTTPSADPTSKPASERAVPTGTTPSADPAPKADGSRRAAPRLERAESQPLPVGHDDQSKIRLGFDRGRSRLRRSQSLPQLKLMELSQTDGRGLAPDAKDLLRRARDENIDALMARYALNLVNGPDGHFTKLNPGSDAEPSGFVLTRHGQDRGSVEQRYEVIEVLADLLRFGVAPDEIHAMVTAAAATADPKATPRARAQTAVDGFIVAAGAEVKARLTNCGDIPVPAGTPTRDVQDVMRRLARVRWVESEVSAALGRPFDPKRPSMTFQADLTTIMASPSVDVALDALDARFEHVMDLALQETVRGAGLAHLDSVKFERFPPDDLGVPFAKAIEQTLPAHHSSYVSLRELHGRLRRGERSAIGGADYAKKRLPKEVLDDVVVGRTKAIVFNGSREAALDHVRARYGTGPKGHRMACRVMGLQGLDGSGPRMLVTMDDGRRFLLMSGLGESRQLHNAGAIVLYEDARGRRVPVEHVLLATDGRDLTQVMRADLERAFESEWRTKRGAQLLGQRVADPKAIATQLVIVQNPQHLGRALAGDIVWGSSPSDATIPFSLAYLKIHGELTRLVLPKVGGHGLYGDTAGDFVRAFFTADLGVRNPNILFNGTAGGFAETEEAFAAQKVRGLPDVKPGGLIMPTLSIEEYGADVGPMTMVTMLGPDVDTWPMALRGYEAQGAVAVTDRHVAVKAPAVETYELIDELVQRGHASVDVEGGAMMRAVRQLRDEVPDITFTPIYTHSDDPRASRHDPFDSLAMMGPLFEGSTFDPDLYDILLSLIGLAHAPKE